MFGRKTGGCGREAVRGTRVVAACWLAFAGLRLAAGDERHPVPPGAARTIHDPGVVPAGGACRGCREPHCRTCRPVPRQGHHGACRGGTCHPHCPVRPQEFGFYETNWRRWPRQAVLPVANFKDATPVRPPKSEVPGVNEESRETRADDAAAPGPEALPPKDEQLERTAPPADVGVDPAPGPAGRDRTAAPEPAVGEPIPPQPPAELPPEPAAEPPAKKPAQDDDLFDEAATGPVPRRFPASRNAVAAIPGRPTVPAVRPAGLQYPVFVEGLPRSVDGDRQRVPRVPFDPAAEAARLGR